MARRKGIKPQGLTARLFAAVREGRYKYQTVTAINLMSRYFIVTFNVRHRHCGAHVPTVTDELSDDVETSSFLPNNANARSPPAVTFKTMRYSAR